MRRTRRHGGFLEALTKYFSKTDRNQASETPNHMNTRDEYTLSDENDSSEDQIKNTEDKEDLMGKMLAFGSENIIDEKELEDYVRKFIDCYKKEFFFNRPYKKGKCQTLSKEYRDIFYITWKVKGYLLSKIYDEIVNLAIEHMNTFKRDHNHKIQISKLASNLVKKAVGFFQVVTGKENNADASYKPSDNESSETVGTTRYFQKVMKKGWRWRRKALYRGAMNYLTNKDYESFNVFTNTLILSILDNSPPMSRVPSSTPLFETTTTSLAPGSRQLIGNTSRFFHSDSPLHFLPKTTGL